MNVVKIQWILIILVLTGGCSNYNYIPNTHNIPLLQEEGEIHLDFSGSFGNSLTYEGQAAFSAVKNFGIIGNISYHNALLFGDEYDDCYGYHVEGGAGTFLSLNRHFIFETYTGFGFGKVLNGYPYSTTAIFRFNRYFLQPSVGYTSDSFDAAFALRMCGLRYHDNQLMGVPRDGDPFQLVYLESIPLSILLEPAVTLRVGWEFAKIQLKAGYSGNITNPDIWQADFYFSLGIYLTLSNKFLTREKPVSVKQ